MRQVIWLFFVLIAFISATGRLSAQSNTLFFLKGVPQTRDINPAKVGIKRGFYIGLPFASRIDMSANTNNMSYNDLIHRGSGLMADSLVWDFDKLRASFDEKNFIRESAALTLLDVGWKRDKDFFGFSWSEREYAELFFTKSLTDLLFDGNAPYLGSSYHSGYIGMGTAHYREFAFSFARTISRKISFGISGKLLFGMAGAKSSGLNVIAGMPEDGNQIDLRASGSVFISAPVDIEIVNMNGYKIASKNNFDVNTYLSNFSNPGVAVDLGITNKLGENFELSVSLVDLGFISWKRDISAFAENGHFLFKGINLNAPGNTPPTSNHVKELFLALRDSMREAFFPLKNNNKFNTLLPVKLYVAGEYRLNEEVTLGGIARIRMFNNNLNTSLTGSINTAISDKLSISASYSAMESTLDNLGLAAAYRFKMVQLYIASDNVIAFFLPTTASNTNIRAGINLLFNDENKRHRMLRHRY